MDQDTPGADNVLPYESPPPRRPSSTWRPWVALGLYLASMATETGVSTDSRPGWALTLNLITRDPGTLSSFDFFTGVLPLLVNGLFVALVVCELGIRSDRPDDLAPRVRAAVLSALAIRGAVVGMLLWLIESYLSIAFNGFRRFPTGVLLWFSAFLVLTVRRTRLPAAAAPGQNC